MRHSESTNVMVLDETGVGIECTIDGLVDSYLSGFSMIGLNQFKEANFERNHVVSNGNTIGAYSGFPHRIENKTGQRLELTSRIEFFENYFQKNTGSSVVAFFDENVAWVTRDVVGGRPAYMSENEDYVAFASEKKALWALGLRGITTIPPGHHAELRKEGAIIAHNGKIRSRQPLVSSQDRATELLYEALMRTVKRLSSVKNVGLLYSGGLDSTIAASMLQTQGVEVTGCVAGLPGSHDISTARRNAKLLGLDLEIYEVPPHSIKNYLRDLVRAVEGHNSMDISIGLPLMFAASKLKERGLPLCSTGQGCDELFGGYSRYLRTLKTEGYQGLRNALQADVRNLHLGLERDSKVLTARGLEMWSPYIERDVVELGLRIAPELKISGPDDMLRKRIVREVGKRLGLPTELLELRKKAAQYGSGFHKELLKQNLYAACEKLYQYEFGTH